MAEYGKGDKGHHDLHHVSPLSAYVGVFSALLVLTVLTVGVSYMGLGRASIWVAMGIAVIKAALVVGFFMHLKYDTRFNSLIFGASVLFMIIFFLGTLMDLGSRGMVLPEQDTMTLRKEQFIKQEEEKRAAAIEAAKQAQQQKAGQPAPAGQQPGAKPAPTQQAPTGQAPRAPAPKAPQPVVR